MHLLERVGIELTRLCSSFFWNVPWTLCLPVSRTFAFALPVLAPKSKDRTGKHPSSWISPVNENTRRQSRLPKNGLRCSKTATRFAPPSLFSHLLLTLDFRNVSPLAPSLISHGSSTSSFKQSTSFSTQSLNPKSSSIHLLNRPLRQAHRSHGHRSLWQRSSHRTSYSRNMAARRISCGQRKRTRRTGVRLWVSVGRGESDIAPSGRRWVVGSGRASLSSRVSKGRKAEGRWDV